MAKKYEPPKDENADLPDKAIRAIAAFVPGGNLLTEILQRPIEIRRQQWMDMVAHGLEKLEERFADFGPENLSKNEAFVTAMMHASQIAIRNHQVEKREALRNAVLNVACSRAPEEDLQLMFLNFIDTLTPWHVRILRFLQEPAKFANISDISAGGLSTVIERAFEQLRGEKEFYDQIGKDLYARGLSNTESFGGMMSAHGLAAKRTTRMGDNFLQFISSPIDD